MGIWDMRKLLIATLLTLSCLASACTSETPYGPCIGAFDERDPTKIYKVSGMNVAMGIVFIEFIVPPIIVVLDETLCPIGNRGQR